MMPTMMNSSGQRVSRINSLRMSWTVLKPISGRNSPNEMRPVNAAARSAPLRSGLAGASSAISHLLDFRPAENALRQENHRNGENRESGNVLVVDREIGRPESLNQPAQEPAENRARHGAKPPEAGRGKGFHAGDEAIGEANHAVIDEVHRARDRRQRGGDHEGDRDGAVDVDAEEGRHLGVLLAGALRAAERGP